MNDQGTSRILCAAFVAVFFFAMLGPAAAQQISLQIDPEKTSVQFTLDAALHTVHGSFRAKRGTLQFDPSSGRASGEIVVDAKTGQSGNGMRDRKMHKDVIESDAYPDFSFRPDRITGTVGQGKSALRVHGLIRVHGVEREIEVPAELELESNHWAASVHFNIPYAKWGMKNPSNLFLHVSDSVEIDLSASGNVVQSAVAASNPAQ